MISFVKYVFCWSKRILMSGLFEMKRRTVRDRNSIEIRFIENDLN